MRRRGCGVLLVVLSVALAANVTFSLASAAAQPTVEEIAPPLPMFVPGPSDWQPKFPYPFDQTRDQVTDVDITAQREMCQWYNAQYDTLLAQIDNVNVVIIRNNGDYNVANTSALADAVAANIDRSVEYLAPRAQALTVVPNFAGDLYFPLYQGESFFRIWQQLSNVGAGIRGRQPVWFYGPSLQHAMRWGSKINRSHVCR